MHDGAYATLEAVVRHYNNVDSALKALRRRAARPVVAGAATTATRRRSPRCWTTLDFRLQQPLGLTADEQQQLVAFLKSLTDPAARDLSAIVPSSVPSGLPLP